MPAQIQVSGSNILVTGTDILLVGGACCVGADCLLGSEEDCESSGGVFQGFGTTCDPNPCSGGACCHDGGCAFTNAAACADSGGTYMGDGVTCESANCPDATTGACCHGTACSIQTPRDCAGIPVTCCGAFSGYTDPSIRFDTLKTVCLGYNSSDCAPPNEGSTATVSTYIEITNTCGDCHGSRTDNRTYCDGTTSDDTIELSRCDMTCGGFCYPEGGATGNTGYHAYCDFDFGDMRGYYDYTETLLDECVPPDPTASGTYVGDATTCDDGNPCCPAGSCEDPDTGSCGGFSGYTEGTCYCTQTENSSQHCSVFFPSDGTTYGRTLEYTYVTRYGFVSGADCSTGIIDNTCSCTLTRNFRDGSQTICDCCHPGCTAGFCGDAGGADCNCSLVNTGDTSQHCEHDYTSPDGNATCDITWTITLS